MKTILTTLSIALLPLLAGNALAEVTQDCILEGTVDKQKAEQLGKTVYVAFHSAKSASDEGSCQLEKGKQLPFSEPKNAMIENVPDGSTVSYHYIENSDESTQWQLLSVSMR